MTSLSLVFLMVGEKEEREEEVQAAVFSALAVGLIEVGEAKELRKSSTVMAARQK